jgi:hypothetical protein
METGHGGGVMLLPIGIGGVEVRGFRRGIAHHDLARLRHRGEPGGGVDRVPTAVKSSASPSPM